MIEKRTVGRLWASVVLAALGFAQAAGQSDGRLDVTFSSVSLDSLVSVSQKVNYNQASLDGFRIQIYSGSGISAKNEALAAQAKFQTLFPKEKVYVVYNAPFWRVRVGDYRFRSEALDLFARVKHQFPGCYTVRDNTVSKKVFRGLD